MRVDQRPEPGDHVAADVGGVLHQPLLEQLQRHHRRRARHRVAAKRARMRAGRPRHDVGARRRHAERQARGDPFGDRDHVWPHARVLDREHLPAASHPRLHFVGDEQDAVLLRQLAEPLDELIRRHDVATLALNWLDDERRHLVRGHQMQKNLILDEVEAFSGAVVRRQADRAAVAVGVRRMIDAGHHRAEALALNRLARRQRQRAQRPAVKAAEKRDDVVAPGRVAGELDARLDRFGPGVAEKRAHAAVDRRDGREVLGELHLRLVIEVGARHVQKPLRLLGDRPHDVGMGMAGGVDGNPGGAVEEHVAVDILHHRAFAALNDERITACVGWRDDDGVACDDRCGLGAGQSGFDPWSIGHDLGGPEGPHYFRFHRVPPGLSSSSTPRVARSFRI